MVAIWNCVRAECVSAGLQWSTLSTAVAHPIQRTSISVDLCMRCGVVQGESEQYAGVDTPRSAALTQNLHTPLQDSPGLIFGQFMFPALDCFPQQWLREMQTEACGDRRALVCDSQQVNIPKERLALWVLCRGRCETSEDKAVPERVNLGAAIVHESREPCVDLWGAEIVTVVFVEFVDPRPKCISFVSVCHPLSPARLSRTTHKTLSSS